MRDELVESSPSTQHFDYENWYIYIVSLTAQCIGIPEGIAGQNVPVLIMSDVTSLFGDSERKRPYIALSINTDI